MNRPADRDPTIGAVLAAIERLPITLPGNESSSS
jgi:hypothetical protein